MDDEIVKPHQQRNKHLFRYAVKERKLLGISFFFTFLAVVSDLFAPYLISRIMDREIVNGLGVRSIGVFAGLLALYLLINTLSALTRY